MVPDPRPSSSMTIEVEALPEQLRVPPAPPTTARFLEDLAATVEMPTLGALAPRVLIMDAAEAVIADRGWNLTTAREVASFSGMSVDELHGYFADMRSLLGALAERFGEQATNIIDDATQQGAWKNRPSAQVTGVAVRAVVDLILARGALVRAMLAGDADGLRKVGTYLTQRLGHALAETADPPAPKDVGFAVLIAISIAHHALTVGPEWSGVSLDRAELANQAAQAATAYLRRSL